MIIGPLLVVGGSGLLGRELVRQALSAGVRTAATCHDRPAEIHGVRPHRLDLRRRDDVSALIARLRPATVVNAAYRQADWAATADGAAHVAAAAVAAGARLVHVSSDAVFSSRAEPYDENDPPAPVTPYGAAKAAAETAVAALDPAAVIARTSLIVGNGESAVELQVHAADPGVLFTDDVRCPVHVADLAAALLELAAPGHRGMHHVAGADAISRHELGVLVARRDGLDETRLRSGLRADTTLLGAREVRLGCERTAARLRVRLRGAREFLRPGG